MLEQHVMQIGAMDKRIGMMEFLAERVTERNARDFLAGNGIEHHQIFRKYRERADWLDEAEPFQHPECVRAELDAGADLLEGDGLLDHLRGDALARQRQGRGQPADAAADDQHLLVFPGRHSTTPRLFFCRTRKAAMPQARAPA